MPVAQAYNEDALAKCIFASVNLTCNSYEARTARNV